MKRHLTGKACMTLGLMCVLFLLPAETFPWNQATHAYIADQLGARASHENLNEMWGSVAPDFINYVFDPALCPTWISDQTHGTYSETYMKVWNAAGNKFETSLACGFLSHNQQWGADYTAHISCRTCGQADGYVIVKARQLLDAPIDPANPETTFGDAFATLGMSPDMALLVAHVITEYAVDIRLGSEVDPLLGRKLATAARNETKRFQPLFVKAFAADYAAYCFGGDYLTAASELTAVEKGHRKDMIYLGQAISRPEPVAVQLLAEQLVAVLSELGFHAVPVEIITTAISSSMALCADYKAELDATAEFVGKNLKEHGIICNPESGGRRN